MKASEFKPGDLVRIIPPDYAAGRTGVVCEATYHHEVWGHFRFRVPVILDNPDGSPASPGNNWLHDIDPTALEKIDV